MKKYLYINYSQSEILHIIWDAASEKGNGWHWL